jgi:acyl-coenzyme A thioesterase PaaI-like protein
LFYRHSVEPRIALPGSLSVGQDCFACGLHNPRGLHIPYEKVGDAVEAVFTLGAEFSGAPAYVHGGVVMTVIDEGMSWATIALRSRFAVTQTFSSRFRRPVLIDEPHTLRVECGELEGRTLQVTAVITRADGKTCTTAEGTYYAMTVEETASASGVPQLPEEMVRTFGFPGP